MVEPGALETCHTEQPSEASKLVRTRVQRIPSRSRASAHTKTGYICADPTARLHFSLATRPRTIHSVSPTIRGFRITSTLIRSQPPDGLPVVTRHICAQIFRPLGLRLPS